ncbi:hypothetical protein [Nocardia sp. NPDC052112]|uniref:hypothetical protein n=1 Tax=Nocardia sp. NPDC052112 TaxID=3155646 RepID=UPI0034167565
MSERCTEVDGWVAHWLLDHHHVRIMLVGNESETQPLFSAAVLAAVPDLAEMRERFPKLSGLWDAIRREYWAEFFTAQENSRGTI